ncbi:MAG: transposon-encoded TnpW family protein [Ruminococcus sp.]|nr:transposon-encoded TnpW family protein [Ruminococcus sp.]
MTDRITASYCRFPQDSGITIIKKYTAVSETPTEYHFGRTTYSVTTYFNSAYQENLSDVLKRLILRECENILGENG